MIVGDELGGMWKEA